MFTNILWLVFRNSSRLVSERERCEHLSCFPHSCMIVALLEVCIGHWYGDLNRGLLYLVGYKKLRKLVFAEKVFLADFNSHAIGD